MTLPSDRVFKDFERTRILLRQFEEVNRLAYIPRLTEVFRAMDMRLNALSRLQANFMTLDGLASLSSVGQVNIASQSISRLLQTAISKEDLFADMSLLSQGWLKHSNLANDLSGVLSYQTALYSHLIDASKLTALAQVSLSKIDFEEIGSALNISTEIRNSLSTTFLDFSSSYSELRQVLDESVTTVLALPPIISSLPSLEYFNSSYLLKVTSIDEADEYLDEEKETLDETSNETKDALERLLFDFNPSSLNLWRGANEALDSKNVDRIRHYSTSIRELLTHILHFLAPDELVASWTTDPNHFHNNSPTRKARLLYICREINIEPYSKLVEKDVAATLEFLNLFQRGTHELEVSFNDAQISALKIRAESTIRYVLEIGNFDK